MLTEHEKIVALVLEADDDETIKDILGPDYQEPLPQPAKGEIFRHDRWADVKVGNRHYCVSYLTPVAYTEGGKVVRTDRHWSSSTLNHIRKWLNHLGFNTRNWGEVQELFPETVSQEKLVEIFKEDAQRVKWSKRQARKLDAVPNKVPYYKSGSEDRVNVNPYHEPPKEWDL